MGTQNRRRAAYAGVAAVAVLGAGFGTSHALAVGSGPDKVTKVTDKADKGGGTSDGTDEDSYESTLELSDGRQVHVRLVEGTGVQERHQDAGSDTWSKWQTLHASDKDRCQGVTLKEVNGTVSLIADFGKYCSDGEPPQESVAAVGTKDLAKWETDVAKDFDGWQDTSINDDGSKVLFLYNSDAGLYTLGWEQSEGFGEMASPKR